MRQEGEESLNVPASVDDGIQFNGLCSETNAVVPASSINIPDSALDTFISVPESVENEISGSVYLPSSDVSASSPLASDEPDLANLRYYYLFRPKDHEITVRIGSATQFKCTVCRGIYKQKFSLKRHFLRCHVNTRYISKADISNCKITVPGETPEDDNDPDVTKTAKGRKKFKTGKARFLADNKGIMMPGLYKCHMCVDVSFDFEHELKCHYDEHSEAEKSKFQCNLCDASFYKKQLLSRHLSNHGGKIVKKKCKKCDLEFSSKSEYQNHLSSHASGRMCKYCAKILSNPANRKRHEGLHMGVKPYSCVHCGNKFSQSKDLDRHFRKRHSELCRTCPLCNKLLPSEASLEVHERERHFGSSKKTDNSNGLEEVDKPSTSKPVAVPSDSTKMKICYVCKKSFQTFYAMMKHKTQAHPYHTRRRRHKKTVKQRIAERQASRDVSEEIKKRKESGRAVNHSDKFSTSNHEQRMPAVNSGRPRFPRQNFRAGPRFPGQRRHREQAEKELEAFYENLSQNIAKNLCSYVVGTQQHLNKREYNFEGRHDPVCEERPSHRINWSKYNFPNSFDVDFALKSGGYEVQSTPENLSERDKLLHATGLNRVYRPFQETANDIHLNSVSADLDTLCSDIKLKSEEAKFSNGGRNVPVVYLCPVCKQKFEMKSAFEEHYVNNHPNLDYSCFQIEGREGSPTVTPSDPCKQNVCEKGVYFVCSVPPVCTQISLVCTKCNSHFDSREEFHSHIVECGDWDSSSSFPMSAPKRMKVMKIRGNKFFRSSSKLVYRSDDAVMKYSQKSPRSAEKMQFYKSGRLQTTSLTVDKNYFNTKPVKPVKTPSKRGRKSYASLSIRYKNSRNQSANSVECSECKESFPSQTSLNLHLQNHNLKGNVGSNTHSAFNNDLNNTSSLRKTSGSPSVACSQNKNFATNERNASPIMKSFSGPSSARSTAISKPSPANTKSNYSSVVSNTVMDISRSDSLSNSEISEAPIDLSKSSKSENISHDLSNEKECHPQKSAVTIAMEAIQNFYWNSSEEQSESSNEHISKLKETVEKLHLSSQLPSVVKPNVNRKVGRPKKVKRIIRPHPLKKTVEPETQGNTQKTNSKPVSKLEETVKRLTENKSKEQKKDAHAGAVNNGNTSVSPNSSNQKTNSTDTLNISLQTFDDRIHEKVSEKASISPLPISPAAVLSHSTPKNFVPIKAHGSQGEELVANANNHNPEKLLVKPKACKSIEYDSSSHQKLAESMNENTVEVNSDSTPNSTLNDSNEQGNVSSFTNSSDDSAKTSDKSRRASGSQGRISPSLESIVNSIKQKLHSQEQESSPQEDSVITWLEDDKFEIPPSRPKVKVPENSSCNSDSMSVSCKNLVSVSPGISKPQEERVSLKPDMLQASSHVPTGNVDETISCTIPSKSALETNNSATSLASSISQKLASALRDISGLESSLETSGKAKSAAEPEGILKKSTTSANEGSIPTSNTGLLSGKVTKSPCLELAVPPVSEVLKKLPTLVTEGQTRSRKRIRDSVEAKPKATRNRSETVSPSKESIRKRPGRPKKKISDPPIDTTLVSEELPKLNSSNAESKSKIPENLDRSENCSSGSSVNNLNSNDSNSNEASNRNFSNLNAEFSEPDLQRRNKSDNVSLEKDDSQKLNSPGVSCSVESDAVSNAATLKECNTLSKHVEHNIPEATSSASSSITTEFGKNLASRIKQNLRLSIENASVETQVRSDKNYFLNLADAPAPYANSNLSEFYTDIRLEIVKEQPDPQFCPFCKLDFSYLTNFKRHLKICKARIEKKEVEPLPSTSTSVVQHLPKKDEVEHSMLNLLRHQSRQSQIIKEAEKNKTSGIEKNFSFTCNYCNRIYLSLYKLMQHKVTHKLVNGESSCDTNARTSTMEDSKEVNETEDKFSASVDLAESDTQNIVEGNKNVAGNSVTEIGIDAEALNCGMAGSPSLEGVEANNEPPSEQRSIVKHEDLNLRDDDSDSEASGIVCKKTESPTVRAHALPKNSNLKEVDVKGGEQPAKRKRGRPFGWRKNFSISPEPVKKEKIKNSTQISPKSNVLLPSMKKKAKSLDTIKAGRKKIMASNLKARPDNITVKSEKPALPQSDCPEMKAVREESSPSTPEKLKNSPKRSATKNVAGIEPAPPSSDVKVVKGQQKSDKSPSGINQSPDPLNKTNLITKRGRGRPPSTPQPLPSPGPNKTLTVKPESSGKRRPGRPPKNLLPTPSTSQTSKSFYSQPGSSRNYRKMVSRAITVDSSDSESDVPEEAPKKKAVNFKICRICNEKFPGSLILYRHIQLVHNRKSQQTPAQSDPNSSKISKKVSPKAAVVENSDGDRDSPAKTGNSPVKKSPHHKICPICKGKFSDNLTLHRHIKLVHSRRTNQADSAKSEPPVITATPVKAKKKIALHNRSALTRVCRKPLPPMKRKWNKKDQRSK